MEQIVSYKIKLNTCPKLEAVLNKTTEQFRDLFNFVCENAYEEGVSGRIDIHNLVYHSARDKFKCKSQYVISAIAKAKAALDNVKTRRKKGLEVKCPRMKKSNFLLLDTRLAMIHEGRLRVSLIDGMYDIPFSLYPAVAKHWHLRRKGCEIVKKNGKWYMTVFLKLPSTTSDLDGVVGIDRGVNNIAVTSDNKFYNSKHLKNIKGRYQFNRSALQSKGTRSAKRKLKSLSGRENRFVRDVNHCLSKKITDLPFKCFVIEDLNVKKTKDLGKKFNKKLGGWSFYQLEQFLIYKAALKGKEIIKVSPKFTSQKCSRCGNTKKSNRKLSSFKCKDCGFQIHADLNAARNIAIKATRLNSRLASTSPTASQEAKVTALC